MRLEDRLSHPLRNKLNVIKRKAEPLLERIKEAFPKFTIHDISHSEKVLDILGWLIPDGLKKDMDEWEVFFLACAAVLHDIGMMRFSESEKGKEKGIRENHHIRSEEYITKNKNYEKLGFDDEHQALIVGRLCRGHRENPEEYRDYYNPDRGYKEVNINMPLLVMFLQIADALDLTFERTPVEYYERIYGDLDSVGRQEWERQMATSKALPGRRAFRIEVDISGCQDPRIVKACELYVNKIQKLLNKLPNHLHNYRKYWKSIFPYIYLIKPEWYTEAPSTDIIFPVRNIEDLFELERKSDFLENRLCGKFIDVLGERVLDWRTLMKERIIDFSWTRFPKKEEPYFTICFIIGKYGVGKTAYLFYWLDECLSSKKCWFKSVVFLNPTKEAWNEEEIVRKLESYDPENVILAIDALYRETDDNNILKRKFQFILEKIVRSGFRVIITLRDTHFRLLQKEYPIDFHAEYIELKPTKKSTENILKNYLRLYKVDLEPGIEPIEFKEAISLLHQKSEGGLPYHIHHFIRMLSLEGKLFSKQAVEKLPLGIKNLIWHTIDAELLIKDDETIPLILRTLVSQRNSLPLSFDFLKYFSEWYVIKNSKKELLNEVLSKLSLLRMYLNPRAFELGKEKIERYQLDEIWKESLEYGLQEPESLTRPFVSLEYFKEVSGFYGAVKEDFVDHTEHYLSETLENSPSYREIPFSAILLADLAKFDTRKLPHSSKLFFKSRDRTRWSDICLNYIRNELSLAWFVSAIDLRDEGRYKEAEAYLEEAIKIREFKQALHFYAHLLEKRMAQIKREESYALAKKIEEIYSKLVDMEWSDYITWQARAVFYKRIGEFNKAEDYFEIAYDLNDSFVPTLQAYGIFCEDMGNRLWNTEREKAKQYFNKAYKLFEQGRKIAKKTGFSERWLLNAFANFLADWAGKTGKSYEEKIELDRKADDIWREVIRKYQNPRDINGYANFLMKTGWRLSERYPGGKFGKNIDVAEEKLRVLIKSPHNDPVSQHILARLLYKCKQYRCSNYEEKQKLFEEAESLLNKSAENPNVSFLKNPELHKASCYHELGRLYMDWADEVRGEEQEKRKNLLRLAKVNLNKAKNIPENNSTYHHLSTVYKSFSTLHLKFYRNWKAAEKYAEKAVEFARKAEWTSKTLSAYLITAGDEIFRQEPKIALYFYEKAAEIEKENYRLFLRMGRCHSKLAGTENFEVNISKAIDDYCKVAEIQKTENGYRLVRRVIQRDVKKRLGPWNGSLWRKCLERMKFCSEKIVEKGSYLEYLDDYINYSEDLMDLGRWMSYDRIKEAIKFFKASIRILSQIKEIFQDERLLEGEIRNKYARILDLEETCRKWIKKLEVSAEKLVRMHEILELDITTCEKFGDFERAKGISKEYFELLFPLEILDNEKLYEMGEKFSKWQEYEYARKCFRELVRRGFVSSDSLEKLARANMKLGRFEEAIEICQKMITKGREGKIETRRVDELLRKCESALRTKSKISEGLMLLIEVGKAAEKSTSIELAKLFYQTGKRLAQIKKELDLRPIICNVVDREVSIGDLNTIKAIMIPTNIIRSCFWKAKELGFSLSKEDEQVLSDFKVQATKKYLYAGLRFKEEAEKAHDILVHTNYIKASFYLLYFLATTSVERRHMKKELSKAWGRTGGTLVGINNNSLLKMSPAVLLECFQQSVKYDDKNGPSWSQLGWQLLHIGKLNPGKLNPAETAFNKSKQGNKYSFAGLGEIAELRKKKKIEIRNYYMQAVEIIRQSEINEHDVKDLKNISNKLINLGFIKDALEIYEVLKELLIGREKALMNARIQLLKDQFSSN